MHSRQEASRAILEEHLFHPVNLKAAKSLRSEGTITAPNEITLKVRWSPNQAKFIHEQLTSWLTTGDINKLVKLLREEPVAITHPMVFWQLFHLRQLVRTPSEEEEGRRPVWTWKAERHGQDELDEAVLPKGVKPAGHRALLDLLTAWVSRFLPGYAVTQLRQKRTKALRRNGRWMHSSMFCCRLMNCGMNLPRLMRMSFLSRNRESHESGFYEE